EHDEQHLGNAGGAGGNAGEAKQRSNQCDDKKDDCVLKHGRSPYAGIELRNCTPCWQSDVDVCRRRTVLTDLARAAASSRNPSRDPRSRAAEFQERRIELEPIVRTEPQRIGLATVLDLELFVLSSQRHATGDDEADAATPDKVIAAVGGIDART